MPNHVTPARMVRLCLKELRESLRGRYAEQTDIRYGAARGWVDAIITPHETRQWLSSALSLVPQNSFVNHSSFKAEV